MRLKVADQVSASIGSGLPGAQAQALTAALGWGPAGAPGDRYLVAAATLSLLAATAELVPVLVLVDDLHWMDRESAAALLFAARRLRRDAVAFLLAVRSGPRPPAPLEGLPVLALAGLTPAQAASMLPDRLTDPVAARLVERTRGNPLALSEVAGRLTPAQRLGAAPLPDPLPVGARLELMYEPLLAGLSAPAWRAVLLCAAGPAVPDPPGVGGRLSGRRPRRRGFGRPPHRRNARARRPWHAGPGAGSAGGRPRLARGPHCRLRRRRRGGRARRPAGLGATARPRRPLASEPLTSQETRVALLVAGGLSNCEVAAALFLSPKTVEHHLASVFRKRGFRSRTELARAFARAAEHG
jgi:DNA-binding CsgD family transcriptional regulator